MSPLNEVAAQQTHETTVCSALIPNNAHLFLVPQMQGIIFTYNACNLQNDHSFLKKYGKRG
jgi:hypothetical protein